MDTCRIINTLLMAALTCVSAHAVDITVEPGAYTIEKALQNAREQKRLNGTTDIRLILSEGTYRLNAPVILRPEDSGITIDGNGKAVVSGGVQIEGWRKEGKLFVADVPEYNGRPLEFRQLWINGNKAVRARDVADFNDMHRILSLDKPNGIIYVPAKAVSKIAKSQKGEMVLHEMWCIANLRIKSIKMLGDSAAVTFHEPESHIHFMHPWPSPMVNTDGRNSAFYLTGAKELLDTPGEWHLDTKAGKIYYMPHKGEDLRKATVEAPALETLLKVDGTPDNLASNILIKGVTFSHATWMRPSINGHAPLQAGMYMIEAYKMRPKHIRPNGDHKLDNQGWVGRPAAAVSVNCAENINFSECTFIHNASTGIDFHNYTKGGSIDRCVIKDCGGNGIVAGSFGPEGHEAHLPYNPTDERIICTGLNITNNLITDVTNEDWGCIGIAAGFVRDINISYNEISEVSYTGISMGWGWNRQPCAMANNKIRGNFIHHYAKHMYDTAGIYTLGAQPLSYIEENVIDNIYTPSYAHDPHHWFYLYTDEGSSFITVRNNWTPSEKFLKNANGPGNTWENNGPNVADSIKVNAGIKKL